MSVDVVPRGLTASELPAGGALIAGDWLSDPLDMDVLDPQDGSLVGRVRRCTDPDVDRAVAAAAASLHQPWPLHERIETLATAVELVRSQSERFARIIAAEGVKTLREARAEVLRCVETLTVASRSEDALTGETLGLAASARGAGRSGYFTREPIGVVAAISSFNDPLNLVAHKIAPAILAGTPIVVKPSDQTPFSALVLAEILLAAGTPVGRLSVVCGDSGVGRTLVSHPEVAVVSFTGGVATAEAIARQAGLKKLLMELGGNNATIVCADADLPSAADAIVDGAFGVAGQNCLSVQRVYAEEAVFEALLAQVARGASDLVVGPKHDERTDVGPMVNPAAAQRVADMVANAVAQGARVVAGGSYAGGHFHPPTVLTGVADTADVATQEIFGPVVIIEPVASLTEAIARSNDTAYALHAGIFTADVDRAFEAAHALVAGAVLINDTSDFRVDSMPFGGFRQSGLGREGIRSTVAELTAPKCVLLRRKPLR